MLTDLKPHAMAALALLALLGLLEGCATSFTAGRTEEQISLARRTYQAGRLLYELQRYDEAVAKFRDSHAIVPDPVLLYDIAQSLRLGNHLAEAVEQYERYLAEDKSWERWQFHADVRAQIKDLRRRLSLQSPPAAPQSNPPPGPPQSNPPPAPPQSEPPPRQ